jgi:transposase-like protein
MDGQWVFGGVEHKEDGGATSRCFLTVMPDRTKETLLNVIQEYIEDRTTIYSDCWKSYDCLQDEGYEHWKVNHSVNYKDPITGVHTNTISTHHAVMWKIPIEIQDPNKNE